MSRFPIAQMMKDQAPIRSMAPESDSGARFIYADVDLLEMVKQDEVRHELLTEAVFFDAGIACDLYWQGRKDYYVLGEDFGPMRPPYPVMWVEWTIPNSVVIDGKREERGGRTQHGALVTSWTQNTAEMTIDTWRNYRGIDNTETRGQWREQVEKLQARAIDMTTVQCLYYAVDERSGEVVFIPYGKQISLDPDGNYIEQTSVNLTPKGPDYSTETLRILKEASDPNVVWMTLNLVNCRNVTTRQVGSALSRSGREKRQGMPTKRYHTIVLPGMSYRYAGGRRSRNEEAQMAAHRVRGHFATYTAEAPLFGKHVGTYWWGWHIRGSKEHGEVVSDYKLGETG